MRTCVCTLIAAVGTTFLSNGVSAAGDVNWPTFRGRFAAGVAEGYPTPVKWDVAKGENVKWKTPLPGLAHSCLIVWGDSVFVTTAVSGKEDPELKVGLYGEVTPVEEGETCAWKLYCLDKTTGDISLEGDAPSNEFVAWSYPRAGCYMPTPLAYGDYLYLCRDSGQLACYNATTGEQVYRKRVKGAFTASPIAADGKLYLTAEKGDVHVVKAGPEFELLATNSMGEICMATPAVSEGVLIFRTRHHVVAVARD